MITWMTERTTGRTEIVSVHRLRRKAREHERAIQEAIGLVEDHLDTDGTIYLWLRHNGVPSWARGARVRRAGFLQHTVEATEERGH